MGNKLTMRGNQGPVPTGLTRPSTARHPTVPTRRVALTESLRAQQILKGFYVEKDGVKYALPIDSWEDRTVFLGKKMWVDGPLNAQSPLPSMAIVNTVTALLTGIVAETAGVQPELARQMVSTAVLAGTPAPYTLSLNSEPYREGAVAHGPGTKWQTKALAFLRDNVHQDIPARYYQATLGHDLHVGTFADLYARHWHSGWASPFDPGDGSSLAAPLDPTFETVVKTHWDAEDSNGTRYTSTEHLKSCRLRTACLALSYANPDALVWAWGQRRGFVENLGWLSGAKVTDAFVSEEIDELVSATSSEYADFDFHEVGTSTTAENNAHTALQTSSGIARATGTPTDATPIYRNVATITADATESWEEHGIFNNSTSVAMMDRNLTGGQSVVSSDQVQYTYELTKQPEA